MTPAGTWAPPRAATTLGWVHWHNTQRLLGYTADLPPAEFEAAFYAAQQADQTLVGIQ